MRTNVARYGLALLAAVAMSGCYSGGRWTMPSFGKSSPFQSSSVAAPSAAGSPVKPSGIAANSTTAPTSSYASTLTPPVTSQGTLLGNSTPSTSYPTAQNPYPTTPPAYTASTAGVPGAGIYAAPANVASTPPIGVYGSPAGQGNTPSYGDANPAYSSTASTTPPFQSSPANTPPSYSSSPYAPPSYANTTPSYGPTSVAESSNPIRPPIASMPTSNGTTSQPSGGYHNVGDRYASLPSTETNSRYDAAPPTADNRYAAPATDPSSVPLVGSRYASPSAAAPTATGGAYPPPAATGYGAASTITVNPADVPAYRPGSTSDYVPPAGPATSYTPYTSTPPSAVSGM